MNPLEQYPAIRRWVYTGLWLAGLILTGSEGWVIATESAQPMWLTGALGVFPLVASYVGYQARANTDKPAPPLPQDRLRDIVRDGGAHDVLSDEP